MQKRVAGSVKNKVVATELQEERDASKGAFDPEEMERVFMCDIQAIEVKRFAENLLRTVPELAPDHRIYEMTRSEVQVHLFKRVHAFWSLGASERRYLFKDSVNAGAGSYK